VQIFYAISACSGGLISMSSFSGFDNNLLRDTFLVPILDILTGFYAGFAIFTVLGNMYLTKCVSSFAEVAAQGPELAFVVYPEGNVDYLLLYIMNNWDVFWIILIPNSYIYIYIFSDVIIIINPFTILQIFIISL
jgi:hypothetical protein